MFGKRCVRLEDRSCVRPDPICCQNTPYVRLYLRMSRTLDWILCVEKCFLEMLVVSAPFVVSELDFGKDDHVYTVRDVRIRSWKDDRVYTVRDDRIRSSNVDRVS